MGSHHAEVSRRIPARAAPAASKMAVAPTGRQGRIAPEAWPVFPVA
ncbi:hypothetical protein ASZ90_002785 [hydrocarbon metagenome]|uniref:Uncharacterized protein n=1 Tax=hydrocarbon metagenome TaxID=938273 RepID=A0A0W8G2I1_9ZZZZ